MFCTNCGNKFTVNEKFCTNCGCKVLKVEKKKFLKKLIIKIKNHKKLCFISVFVLISIILSLLLFNSLYGFSLLSWDKNYSDYNLNYISPAKIKLGVNFGTKDKINDIKYNVTCGSLKTDKLEIIWDLTESTGKCKITVSYKKRKISKEYTIINLYINSEKLGMEHEIDLDSDEDLDLDGLTNKQEKSYSTNAELSDTDMDGLDDLEEINIKTNPTLADTDSDGLNDYNEIELGLDPLKSDSKGDGQKDGERILSYDLSYDGLKLSITGSGNVADTTVEINSNTKISGKVGLIDKLYSFFTDGSMKEAIVAIPYSDEELIEYNLNEDNLAIYYYNVEDLKYEKIETLIDKEKNILTAKLKHFSNYVVGDYSLLKEHSTAQILFILDNSWSMFSNEQYEQITGEEYYGGWFGDTLLDASDVEGLRFDLTKNLISKLSTKNYKIGLSEFRGDYANALKIGSDIKLINDKLSTMHNSFITKVEGTNIKKALTNGIKEFSGDGDNKYIVILTDGEDSLLKSSAKKIIDEAIKSDVKICSIGFGSGSDNTYLANISNATGCKFYSASNVNGLDELFQNIETELKDDLVDINDDGKNDGILIADSGFIVNKDGFSFSNYTSNLTGGHCYGMATFVELYYKKVLPLKVDAKEVYGDKSYAYNLKNTYFKNYNNLYDYELQTDSLKYDGYLGRYFEWEKPSDYRLLEGRTFVINDRYRKEILNNYYYDIVKINQKAEEYNKVEVFQLNEDKMQKGNLLVNDDLQLFNAIYMSHIKQTGGNVYSSAMDFLSYIGNLTGLENIMYLGKNGFINTLKSRLMDKDPVVISADFSGGRHAINAISLIQDIDNPNYYYIGVYDNNYPGEKRYVDVNCDKKYCVTVANDFYSNSGKPITLTTSLEYDLEYYK